MVLTVVMADSAAADPGSYFGIRVIDEATGRGVPMVTLETVNRIRFITDSAGWTAFDEPGLLGRRVFFSVKSPGCAFSGSTDGTSGVALDTKPGATAEIKVMRLSIAERMYRVTGQGIYRDATRLGLEVPLPRPNLNGEGVMHGAVHVAEFLGGHFWLWNDALGHRGDGDSGQGAAATSEAPGRGGLDPSLGVHFEYIPAGRLLRVEESGCVQFEGLLNVTDAEERPHLVAHYSRLGRDGSRMEHGIAEFNTAEKAFEPVTQLGEEFAWQCPRGHVVKVKSGGREFFYFASPFCVTRVPAAYDDVLNPSKYEALAWSPDAGAMIWQTQSGPISQSDEERLIADKRLPKDKARLQVRGSDKMESVLLDAGSVGWNNFRKKWVMIASEADPRVSKSGRIWYGEAEQAEGPWGVMTCILDEAPLTLTDPLHHVFFDQEGGRLIYFDCTVSTAATGASSIPRYEHNRLMYRLDLGDSRLNPKQATE